MSFMDGAPGEKVARLAEGDGAGTAKPAMGGPAATAERRQSDQETIGAWALGRAG